MTVNVEVEDDVVGGAVEVEDDVVGVAVEVEDDTLSVFSAAKATCALETAVTLAASWAATEEKSPP